MRVLGGLSASPMRKTASRTVLKGWEPSTDDFCAAREQTRYAKHPSLPPLLPLEVQPYPQFPLLIRGIVVFAEVFLDLVKANLFFFVGTELFLNDFYIL